MIIQFLPNILQNLNTQMFDPALFKPFRIFTLRALQITQGVMVIYLKVILSLRSTWKVLTS